MYGIITWFPPSMTAFAFRLACLLLLAVGAWQCTPSQASTENQTANVLEDTLTVAAKATPVLLPIDYDTALWTELVQVDASIALDIRYATSNNFMKEKIYDCPRCFLRPDAAKAVVRAHKALQKQGYGLKMHDCYRPAPYQWRLWKKTPDPRFVADPRKGSIHSRGTAVDLTLVNSKGEEMDMGTPYDYFGPEGYQTYTNLPKEVLANRRRLNEALIAQGFRTIRTEWWHFNYGQKVYPLADWVWDCKTKN